MCVIPNQHGPFTTMTGLTFRTAQELVQDPHACFRVLSTKKHMAMLPQYIGDFSRGIREQLDTEINLFSEQLNGVLMAYSNVRRFQEHGTLLGSQPHIHLYIQADFIIFQPLVGSILKGVVNKVGRDFIGCLVHGCFNASLPTRSQDGLSLIDVQIDVGQTFLFQVVKYYTSNNILSIRGSFYEDSFLNLSVPASKKKVDETDGLNNGTEELPVISRKRRRMASCSVAVITDVDKLTLSQEPKSQEEPHCSIIEPSAKKKKKRKKKERDDDDDISAFLANADQSHEDMGGANQDLPKSNIPIPEVDKKKKKKKKKKEKRGKKDYDEIDDVVDT